MIVTYILVSYIVGTALFIADSIFAKPGKRLDFLLFRLAVWALSPLVAWHGALHYINYAYCKITKQPVKYWI